MYIPVEERKVTGNTTGYVPVVERTTLPPVDYKGTLGEIKSPYSFTTKTSTQAIPSATTPNITPNRVVDLAKTIGQFTARSIASAGVTIASKIDPRVEPLKSEDFHSFFNQALVENIFGKDPNKSIEQRIVEAEPKVKQWGQELKKLADTPTLNTREKLVVKTLSYLAEKHPTTLAFTGIMGEVGLDLSGYGGLEKNVYKAMIQAGTDFDAIRVLTKMGVADDLARQFASDVVKVADEKSAEALFNSIAKLQETTHPSTYIPLASRVAPESAPTAPITPKVDIKQIESVRTQAFKELTRAVDSEDTAAFNRASVKTNGTTAILRKERGLSFDQKYIDDYNSLGKTIPDPLATEARKYKSAEEFVKAQSPIYRGAESIPVRAKGMTPGYSGDSFTRDRNVATLYGENILAKYIPESSVLKARDVSPEVLKKLRAEARKIVAADDANTLPMEALISDVMDIAKEKGKAGADLPNFFRGMSPEQEVRIFDHMKSTYTKSQLTDFYNKVSKPKELPIPAGLPKITATVQKTPETPRTRQTDIPRKQSQTETPQPQSVPPKASQQAKTPPEAESLSSGGSIPQSTYESNRTVLQRKEGRTSRVLNGLKAAWGSVGEGTDKILGTISTRLKNIDPSLKIAIRNFEFKLGTAIQADRKLVAGFLKGVKAKNINIEDYADLDLALKNGDLVKTNEIISKYGLEKEFAQVRTTLDDLYKRAKEVGYDIGYEKNYFPRMIEDADGLLEYLGKGDDWSIINEAIVAKETEIGRYLTVKEKANLVNTLVRGYGGKITLSKTGAMKARQIDVVDANLNQFYRDSVESLIRYIDDTNDAIEARRFFGKGNKTDQFANIDDSIGSYIFDLVAKGKVKPSQEKELRDILQARFASIGTSGVIRVYKNLSYIDTMGSFTSAITQLGDFAFAIYKGGPIQTIKAATNAVMGKSQITRADLGIEKIAQEFEDASRSARAVDRVFRLTGLHKMDALGKETVINAVIARYRKLAESPTTDFMRRLESVFGNDTVKIMDDLKAGRVTEDVKLLAFNELLDVQPVALSEMPEQYLKGGNGRIFYMLKTYTIKLFDVYRNEVFQEIAAGNKTQGLKNLLYLTGALVAMNATADEIKDLMLNRETSLTDRVVDNMLKLAGFSKFTIYKARQEGIGSAVAKTILPPFKFIDSAYKDLTQGDFDETPQSIPIGGKLYYWWFGKGAEKTAEKRKPSGGSSKKLKTPAGLPELPSLKKSLPTPPSLPKLP